MLAVATDDALELSIDEMGVGATTRNPGGHWACAEHGIRIGTSLRDLNRLNGRPFDFSGFGWDYGGSPIDFRGGALEGHGFRMGFQNVYDEDTAGKFQGDATFSSDAPGLEEPGVYVDVLYMSIE